MKKLPTITGKMARLVGLLGEDREGSALPPAKRRVVRAKYEALMAAQEEINQRENAALAIIRAAKTREGCKHPPATVQLPDGFFASPSPDGRITFIWEEEFVPSPRAKLGESISWKEADANPWQVITYQATSRQADGELLFTAILHNRRAVVVVVNTGAEIVGDQWVALTFTLGQDLRRGQGRSFVEQLFNQYQGEHLVETPTGIRVHRRAPKPRREQDRPCYQQPAYQLSSPSRVSL
jgi:hypothetical protein